MNPLTVLLICASLITFGILIVAILLIPVLLDLKKTLNTTNRLIDTIETEIRPTLKTVNRLSSDFEVKFKSATRFLDAMTLAMGGIEEAKKRMLPYLWPSKVWTLSILAGLKKGIEVFFGSKGVK